MLLLLNRVLFGIVCLAFLGGVVFLRMMPMMFESRDGLTSFQESVVTTDSGWEIATYSNGEGVPVVYIHGSPGSAGAWVAYLTDPVPGTRAIAYDRPGFGATTPDVARYRMAEQVEALAPVMAAASEPVVLVGHSLGGTIAFAAAVADLDRVGALVVVAGSIDPGYETLPWYQWVGASGIVPSLLPRDLLRSNEELCPLGGELRQLAPQLDRITCPVFLVHSDDDSLVPYGNAPFARDRLRRAEVEMRDLTGRDHFTIWNSEDEVRSAIADAVAMVKAANAAPAR